MIKKYAIMAMFCFSVGDVVAEDVIQKSKDVKQAENVDPALVDDSILWGDEPNTIVPKYYYKAFVTEKFLEKVDAYKGKFVPLADLPTSTTVCVSASYEIHSEGKTIKVIDDHGSKKEYRCDFVKLMGFNHIVKWVDVVE